MSLFDTATRTRFAQQGEVAFATSYPCILKRTSLAIVQGTHTYQIPNDVLNIKRLTWKGAKLDPLPSRDSRAAFGNLTSTGKPFWYIFNNIGQNLLRLFPVPNESIGLTVGNLYDASVISNYVILEYYCTP